jgi:hypothetical protein
VNKRVKLLLLSLIIVAAPLLAASLEPVRDTPPGPWNPEGGGSGSSQSCSLQCEDGSMSGIACNTGQTAYCACCPDRNPDACPYCK